MCEAIAIRVVGKAGGVSERIGFGRDIQLTVIRPGLHLRAATTATPFNPRHDISALARVEEVFRHMVQCVGDIGLRRADIVERIQLGAVAGYF